MRSVGKACARRRCPRRRPEVLLRLVVSCIMPLGLSGVEFITQYMPGRWNHVPANEDPLERLARLAATDKQWGLHKYTDVYASLFHNMRNDRVNLTEVGVLHGASVVMWASYFRNGNIYGLDPFAVPANRAEKAALERSLCAKCSNITRNQHRGCPSCASRVRLHRCCDAARQLRDEARLVPNSMDIVIEDAGSHSRELQEQLFPIYWPLVRPGGYYILEDVDFNQRGQDYALHHNRIAPPLRKAMEEQVTQRPNERLNERR